MATHTIYIFDTKTSSKDSNLNLLTKFEIGSQTPFDLKVTTELCHEVVDIIHLLHHQRRLTFLRTSERDREQDLLRIEDIIVIQ